MKRAASAPTEALTRRTRIALAACALLCGSLAPASAVDFVSATNYVLATDSALTNETWIQAHAIQIDGKARDDLFLLSDFSGAAGAAPTIRLAGTLENDVWALGAIISQTGTVLDHARLFATKSITIGGPIGNNVIALSDTVRMDTNGVIGGAALFLAGTVMVEGRIHGNTRIRGKDVTLAGLFDGNVNVSAEDLVVMPGTRIDGNLTYALPQELVLDPGVHLGGKLLRAAPAPAAPALSGRTGLLVQLVLFAGAVLAGVLLIAIFPRYSVEAALSLEHSVWKCLLAGFIASALIPMAAVLLLFTLIGIPASLLALTGYALLLYLSKIVVALAVGRRLLHPTGRPGPTPVLPTLVLGLAVVYLAVNLPFPFGLVLWFALTLVGFGALVLGILERRIPVALSPLPLQDPPPLPRNAPAPPQA